MLGAMKKVGLFLFVVQIGLHLMRAEAAAAEEILGERRKRPYARVDEIRGLSRPDTVSRSRFGDR